MKGLFLKTFIWFWLTTIITISVTYLISSRLADSGRHAHDFDEIVEHYFEELELQLAELGTREFKTRLKHQRLPRGLGVVLIDNNDAVIAARRIPRPILQHFLDNGNWPEPSGIKLKTKHKTIDLDSGKVTLYIIWLPKRIYAERSEHKPWFRSPLLHTPRWTGFRFLIALLVSGLICYLLARYISRPVLKLRSAVNQLEQGHYDSKVADEFNNRNDEIAELAADFDRMSANIQNQFQQREELLRDISHELRSPLARMRVASELIKSKTDPASNSEIDRIELEITRLDQLISEIADFSKLKNQSGGINKQQFDLIELIKQIIQDVNFEGKAQNKQAELNTDHKQILLTVNKTLMVRGLENILRNALKYTADNTTVLCSVKLETNEVAIKVKDQGLGVPEHELEKIFEPFYRLSKSRDRESGGTGLGLAISKRAIELHDGQIKAENADNNGLEITIRLPLAA